jgi:hypothetical protein
MPDGKIHFYTTSLGADCSGLGVWRIFEHAPLADGAVVPGLCGHHYRLHRCRCQGPRARLVVDRVAGHYGRTGAWSRGAAGGDLGTRVGARAVSAHRPRGALVRHRRVLACATPSPCRPRRHGNGKVVVETVAHGLEWSRRALAVTARRLPAGGHQLSD